VKGLAIKNNLYTAFFCLCAVVGNAQQIWVEPAFPTADQAATIYFDANACDCPLESYSGTVYAHTGFLKEDNSTWQNVIGTWGNNATQESLRPVGQRVYALDIDPTIAAFYSSSQPGEIAQMAFVFRSADGSQQTKDLFIDVFKAGEVKITQPSQDQIFSENDMVRLEAVILGADSLSVYLNGNRIATFDTSVAQMSFPAEQFGENRLEVTTTINDNAVSESLSFYVRRENHIAPIPSKELKNGVNINGRAATFVFPAPRKSFVYLIGDFTDWKVDEDYQMNLSIDGSTFWLTVDGLDPNEEYAYQYIVDGALRTPDPYTRKVLDPWNDQYIPDVIYPDLMDYPAGKTSGIVSTFEMSPKPYEWQVNQFEKPVYDELVIYELLVRDFVEDHSYQSVIDSLDYLSSLGINAIELMPVMEFEGNSSWGYNTSFHFALDKYYGTENDFKRFVDACHERGIAVILDLVMNHAYGQNPHVRMYWDDDLGRPSENSPYFNPVSPNPVFAWGYDYDHESQYTVEYFNEVLTYWVEEFRIDGYRWDFTKGMTNKPGDGSAFDQSRINILQAYAEHLWQTQEDAYVILEHFGSLGEESILTDMGMMTWGNFNHPFNQVAMGYLQSSNYGGLKYDFRQLNGPSMVSYMESHDEERMMFKLRNWGNQSGTYDTKDIFTAMERAKMATLLWLSVPGPKMLWMFGELGYDISIDDPCRVCEKPIRWDYLDQEYRVGLKDFYSEIIKLRQKEDIFHTRDFDVAAGGYLRGTHLRSADNEVIVVANMDVNPRSETYAVGSDEVWHEYFSKTSTYPVNGQLEFSLNPGEYRMYSKKAFNFTPNPSTDSEIMVGWEGVAFDAIRVQSAQPLDAVRVYDATGREVAIVESNQRTVSVPTRSLAAGIYVVFCKDETGYENTYRMIKGN
jgi:1,4-alpha-glucan branching enzyme